MVGKEIVTCDVFKKKVIIDTKSYKPHVMDLFAPSVVKRKCLNAEKRKECYDCFQNN